MAHLVAAGFLEGSRTELDAIKTLFWLAECEEIAYHAGFDATYTWRWMHKTEQFAKHQTGIEGFWDLLMQYNDEFPGMPFGPISLPIMMKIQLERH